MTGNISIVIPAFNEAGAIKPTLAALREMIKSSGLSAEIIVVDDGSTDGTGDLVMAEEGVRLIRHRQNRGYGASLKTGIRQANNDVIVITDADGTYPIEMIPVLAAEIGPFDMVVGARTGREVQIPLVRRPAKAALTRLANYLSGIEIPDLNSGLRAMKRDIVMSYFRLLPSGFSFTTSVTLAMLTNDYNVSFVPIDYFQRTGSSKIHPIKDTINFFSLVVRMVLLYRPLRVFIPVVLVMMLLSAVKVLYDINAYDFHLATSTVVLVTLTVQILVLGLIADLVVSLHKHS
ncbi:MAG: glycosyltransferase family 2 protein [Candidatus Promineifilaceae bacterium]